MKALSTSRTTGLLIAAITGLAASGSALAAGTGACAGDPHAPYYQSFFADGQYECTPAAQREVGARGPAGPVMAMDESAGAQGRSAGAMANRGATIGADPWMSFRSVFIGD